MDGSVGGGNAGSDREGATGSSDGASAAMQQQFSNGGHSSSGDEAATDDGRSETQWQQSLEEAVAEVLCALRPLRPDMIRAVRAGRTLKCCGRAFRKRSPRSFRMSFQTGTTSFGATAGTVAHVTKSLQLLSCATGESLL